MHHSLHARGPLYHPAPLPDGGGGRRSAGQQAGGPQGPPRGGGAWHRAGAAGLCAALLLPYLPDPDALQAATARTARLLAGFCTQPCNGAGACCPAPPCSTTCLTASALLLPAPRGLCAPNASVSLCISLLGRSPAPLSHCPAPILLHHLSASALLLPTPHPPKATPLSACATRVPGTAKICRLTASALLWPGNHPPHQSPTHLLCAECHVNTGAIYLPLLRLSGILSLALWLCSYLLATW